MMPKRRTERRVLSGVLTRCAGLVEELRQLQGWVAAPMVEQESHGVREDFAQQPIGEVPEVARPHSLHGVTPGELRKNGVDAVAKTAQQRAAFGSGISFLGRVGRYGQMLWIEP